MPQFADDEGRYHWKIPGGGQWDSTEIPHPAICAHEGCRCLMCRYERVTKRIMKFSTRADTTYNRGVLSRAHGEFEALSAEVREWWPWVDLQMPKESRSVTAEEVDNLLHELRSWYR